MVLWAADMFNLSCSTLNTTQSAGLPPIRQMAGLSPAISVSNLGELKLLEGKHITITIIFQMKGVINMHKIQEG